MNAIIHEFVIGPMLLVEEKSFLVRVDLPGSFAPLPPDALHEETPLLQQARQQLEEYFRRERREFTLPLAPHGTPFQLQAWKALCAIPYGETRSYRQLAEAIGRPKAFRAVGGANHNNPIAIIIPCHRVIGADGSLTGYGGGLDIKEKLLKLEQD